MSFKTSISGLQAASAALDVTGNNIANSQTVGFKKSRSEFADVYAVSNLGTSQDAIGQGVQVSAVAQQFAQGNVVFTDNSLDLATNGQGFFVLEDSGARVYSRAGTFGVDKDGYVVNSTGQNLMAFGAVGGTITGALTPLQLTNTILPPQATTAADASLNLDAASAIPAVVPFDPFDSSSYNFSTSLAVYDSLGVDHLATMYFVNTGVNSWDTHLRIDGDNTQTLAVQPIAFDTSGNLTTAMPFNYGAYNPTTGAAPFTVDVDFTGTTQVGADFGVFALSQDGFTSGLLSGIDIDEQGVVLARFTNGQSQIQGQVVLADFSNAQGMQPVSETIWAETNSSGPALVGAPGSASLGLLQAGALEQSNVDLSEELVNMIIAQRFFQANAQAIRVEDEVTQTIINIR